jgi:Contractile injection system tube protein
MGNDRRVTRDDALYPVKATLTNQEPGANEVFTFQFNPTKIAVSRDVTWGGGGAQGRNQQGSQQHGNVGKRVTGGLPVDPDTGIDIHGYVSTSPFMVTINDILFDTFEERPQVAGDPPPSVDFYIEQLKKTVTPSVQIPGEKGSKGIRKRPPTYLFTFGPSFTFVCAVKTLSWTYSVWWPDGTPLRALVKLVLQETTLKKQNPPPNTTYVRDRNSVIQVSASSAGASVSAGAATASAGISFSAGISGFI